MSKLLEDTRVAGLGAAVGLLSSSVFLMLARIDTYYEFLEEGRAGEYIRFIENLWWLPVSLWQVVLSIGASLMAHRYLKRDMSPFLLWQAIGCMSLLGWGLTFGLALGMEWIRIGGRDFFFPSINWLFIAKYISTLFACHVLYGSAMQAASREYLPPDASLQLTNEICNPVDRLRTDPSNNLDPLHISRSAHD